MHEVFKALSSEPRVEILRLIEDLRANKVSPDCCGPNEVCVCKILERLDLAPSTVSHHLHELKEAGLLSARRDGKWIYYSVRKEKLAEAARFLLEL